MNEKDFIFLICSERSGSNLLTKMFDNHPLVCGPTPAHLLRALVNNRVRYGDLKVDENWETLIGDIADYLDNQLGQWITEWPKDLLLTEIKERSIVAILKTIYLKEAAAHGKTKLFVKENQTYKLLPFLLINFPASRYILQVRDSRDMALSWKKSPNHPGGVFKAANTWKEDQSQSLGVLGSLQDADKICWTRYEDLVSKPKVELRRLCEYLGIDFHHQMLAYHQKDLTQKNSERVLGWQNLGKPVITDNFGKYRGELTELEIRYVENLCHQEMDYFGYTREYPLVDDFQQLAEDLQNYEKDHPIQKELSEEEQEIRKQRLAVIRRIITRDLWR